MKFTLSWLKKFLNTDSPPAKIADSLTQIGLEVEEIIDRSTELKDFEVAYILSTKQHPSSDRLRICEVQTKEGILQIICGAPNARANIKVVLAKIGTFIPNGKFKIKESIIRGEKSYGMLCSAEELLLDSNVDGIIELVPEAKIGDPFIKYYGLDDPVFHINVTPNRGDALGIYSIARDLAAKNIGKLQELTIPTIESKFQSQFTLNIEDRVFCPLFSLREIRNVNNKPSPDWLRQLLQNIGVKSVSTIVDVTNYISYSFGQPMHVYDRDKLSNNINVGLLDKSVKFKALNGKIYDLEQGDLVVMDAHQVQAIAGIIGGNESSYQLETQHIILEAACFAANPITKTGRRLQLDSDARYRFERKIDQSFTIKALNIATQMIIAICNGTPSQIIYEGDINPKCKSLEFSPHYLTKITGLTLATTEICTILEKLGFKPVIIENVIKLTVPAWRHDIEIKEDIVEEIIRIYGYDKLKAIILPTVNIGRIIPQKQRRISDIKRILAHCGYDEVVTNSFMNSESAKLFAVIQEELLLLNPINSDSNYMRPTIVPNLLKLIRKNFVRSIRDIALFEVGPVFISSRPDGELSFASGVRCGHYVTKNCHSPSRFVDVFDIKSDLAIILDYIGLSIDKCQYSKIDLPYYHPAKSTSIKLGKNIVAYFGQIHPLILKHFDIDCDVFTFELNIANIPFSKAKFGRRDEFTVSNFQITSRDYAFVLDVDQPVGEIISYIKNFNRKLVKSVDLFDIYLGDKLPSGKKSVAISVQLQDDDHTLNEIELNKFSQEIIAAIEQKFGGQLREDWVE